MAENFRDNSKESSSTKLNANSEGDHSPARLVKWEDEQGKKPFPLQLADAPASPQPPGSMTVHFDPSKGLDKQVAPDVVHLTIDSPTGINLATNLVYGLDTQGRQIPPHYHTVIGLPSDNNGAPLRGQFDLPPNLQDIKLHYTDAKGVVHDQTYPASALRLEGDANVLNSRVNDFKKPDPQRAVSQWYPVTSSMYEYAYRLSDIPGKTLGFMEQSLINDKASDKTSNPYIDINLAEVRVGLAMQHYQNSFNGRFAPATRTQEKTFAMSEMEEAKKNYDSAMYLGQKDMQALPNPGDPMPHSQTDFLNRRYAPEPPYGQDYLPKVYGAAIDTANWRKSQMNLLEGMMLNNSTLPARQRDRIDQP
jgi:hypothetical protein